MQAERSLVVSASRLAGVTVLVADGVLDSTTYLPMRNVILKAALDEPDAVIVDVNGLDVPATSALAVFTSARWLIGQWPDIPMALVCENQAVRTAIERNGVSRYVRVYPTTAAALSAVLKPDSARMRRRARAELPATQSSTAESRRLVGEWLTAWGRPEFISSAKLIMSVFVENVLVHTCSAPDIRLESQAKTVTVAVGDSSTAQAVLHEACTVNKMHISGLAIVAALCRGWGNRPTPAGKMVWAVIGPENVP